MTTKTKENWRTVRLADVVDINACSVNSNFPYKEIEYIDISAVGSGTLVGGLTEYKFSEAPGRARRLVKDGDIILSTVRPNRRSFLYIKNPRENTVASTGFAVLSPGPTTDSRFLYYLVTRQKFTDYLSANAKGSAYPAVSSEVIADAEVLVPTYDEQKRIAGVLAAFDEKIENNNRIIKTLEEIAQMIFKEWFIDNPSNGEVISLTELADFINGGAFGKIVHHTQKGLPLIKIAEFSRGITEKTEWIDDVIPEKYLVKDGDLLFSWSGSLDLHIWHKGNAVLNQHLFNVIPKDSYTKGLLCVVLRSTLPWFRQIAQSKATSIGHIQRHHLEEQKIVIPANKDLSIFENFYQKLVSLMIENQKLVAMRDLLLPKLMSGEVTI